GHFRVPVHVTRGRLLPPSATHAVARSGASLPFSRFELFVGAFQIAACACVRASPVSFLAAQHSAVAVTPAGFASDRHRSPRWLRFIRVCSYAERLYNTSPFHCNRLGAGSIVGES